MNKTILILLLLVVPALSFKPGQKEVKQWTSGDYKKITHKNFRSHSRFKKKIDFGNIDYRLLDAAVFYLANEAREKEGISIVEYCENLEISAWNHSYEMITEIFFSHENIKDATRKTVGQRLKLAGITNPMAAENIAMNYSKGKTYLEVAEAFHNQWMNSPGHRANILSARAKQLGWGLIFYKGQWMGTQNFQCHSKAVTGTAKDKLPGKF